MKKYILAVFTALLLAIGANAQIYDGITQPAPQPKPKEKQMESIPEETQAGQDEEFEDIDSGMQKARTIICPHCGKEIVL